MKDFPFFLVQIDLLASFEKACKTLGSQIAFLQLLVVVHQFALRLLVLQLRVGGLVRITWNLLLLLPRSLYGVLPASYLMRAGSGGSVRPLRFVRCKSAWSCGWYCSVQPGARILVARAINAERYRRRKLLRLLFTIGDRCDWTISDTGLDTAPLSEVTGALE